MHKYEVNRFKERLWVFKREVREKILDKAYTLAYFIVLGYQDVHGDYARKVSSF